MHGNTIIIGGRNSTKRIKRLNCLIGFLIFICVNFQAASELQLSTHTHFYGLNDPSRLSNAIVNDIVEDLDGAMWFATQDGLYYYDGYNFKVFKPSTKPGSLKNNNIESLFIDSKGRLWAGTGGGGLSLFLRETESFQSYRNKQDINSLSSDVITSITEDAEKNLWIGTLQGGLNRFNPETEKFEHFDKNSKHMKLSDNDVWDVYYDKKFNQLFVATEYGINQLFLSSNKSKYYQRKTKAGETLYKDNVFKKIAKYREGEFILSGPLGNFLLNLDDSSFSSLSAVDARLQGFTWDLLVEPAGEAWFAVAGKGLLKCNLKKYHCQQFKHNNAEASSISSNDVRTIFHSNKNIYWFGTTGSGITILNPDHQQFGHMKLENFSQGQPQVWAFETTTDERLLIGTFGAGLLVTQNKLSTGSQSYTLDQLNTNQSQVTGVTRLDNGDLWVASWGEGLVHLAKDLSVVKQFKQNPNIENSLSFNYLLTLYSSGKDLWIGTYGKGLERYDLNRDIFEHFMPNKDSTESIGYYKVSAIYRDSKQRLWIGTYGGGLDVFDEKKNTFMHIKNEEGVTGTLPHNSVVGIIEDLNGNVWFGTEGGGIARLVDFKNKRFSVIDEENGLANNNVAAMLLDDQGNLWVSHNAGIDRIDIKSHKTSHFLYSDGLQSNAFNTHSAIKLSDGRLIFGGGNGINLFDPSVITDVPIPRSPKIQRVIAVVNGATQSMDRDLKPIVFGDAVDYIKIYFSPNFFSSSRKPTFRYRLPELSKQWVEQKSNELILSGLKSGDYQLEIQAGFGGDLWSNKSIVNISVLPPFYLSNFALISYLILAVLIAYLYARFRVHSLQRYEILLENKVEKRSLELSNALKQRDSLFENVSHELKTPLTLILGRSEQLLRHVSISESTREELLKIEQSAKRLFFLVSEILQLSEAKHFRARKQPTDLIHETKIIVDSLSSLAELKDCSIRLVIKSMQDTCWVEFQTGGWVSIITNLLTNAIKHGSKGQNITVLLNLEQKHIGLTVSNHGPPLDLPDEESIYSRFNQLNKKREGQGLGLSIVKEIVDNHRGSLDLDSIAGINRFHISIPKIKVENNIPIEIKPFSNQTSGKLKGTIKLPLLLVVEDNQELGEFICSSLVQEFNVCLLLDGIEAVKWLQINPAPDLIVSDVMMPNMNGYQLCEKLKQDDAYRYIPFFLLTAKMDNQSIKKGLSLAADDYIGKPFSVEILLTKIRNQIATREALKRHLKATLLTTNEEPINITQANNAHQNALLIDRNGHFLAKIRDLLATHYTNSNIKISALANLLHQSERSINRKLNILTGSSLNELLREFRLEQARHLLEQGVKPKDACFDCGFNSMSYFSRSYRDKYNHSPSKTRSISNKQR